METSFGNWIKRRRKALDLSQKDLADKIGCSVSTVLKIESDARRPSRQIAELLAGHLQIPPDQRPQFIKIARRERMVESLEPLPVPLEPLVKPANPPPASNLPYSLTPLVGREHELDLVIQQLREAHCRLLTLTGLGGVGKTRLALEAAGRLKEDFPGGVFFIPLAGIADPDLILPAIADGLSIPFSGSADPMVELLNYLRGKEILLVIDNFEHLLAGASLVVQVLQDSPRTKVMVTSREPLNLRAEWALEVQGLPVPGGSGDSLETSSAAQLFLQRARQARLGFQLENEDRQAVLRICQLVEGLPLGIELAATWVRTLSPPEIALEIERNLDFLKVTARDLPERHRSLQAVLDHSWDLLSGREQEVFSRLSVFRSGFRREAAREVAGAGLEEIASLLNKSLLKRVGEERYDLHELLRQFAAARLEALPREPARALKTFRRYYAERLEGWRAGLRGPGQLMILEEMVIELENLRTAWKEMVQQRQFGEILRSLFSLWQFHEIRGRFQEGADLFGQAILVLQPVVEGEDGDGDEDRLALGRLLALYGYFCSHLGRYEQAWQSLGKGLDLIRSTADQAALAEAQAALAYLLYRQGEFQQAGKSALESLDLNRALENPVGEVFCLVTLSYIHLAEGAYDRAFAASSESLSICRDCLGDPHGMADSLITLSRAARHLGQYEQAERFAQEGLEISLELNDRWGAGQTLRDLGLIALEQGEARGAVEFLSQSVAQFQDIGDRPLMAGVLLALGRAYRASGLDTQSKGAFQEALWIANEIQNPALASQACAQLAGDELEAGE